MKSTRPLVLGCAALAAILVSACSGVNGAAREDGAPLPLAAVIDRALAASPGVALEGETGDEDDPNVCSVKIAGADGVREVHIASRSGEVLGVEDDDEADEALEVLHGLAPGTRALASLVAAAERAAKGVAREAEFEIEGGRTIADVLVLGAEGLVEVELDGVTGDVLEIETASEAREHEDDDHGAAGEHEGGHDDDDDK